LIVEEDETSDYFGYFRLNDFETVAQLLETNGGTYPARDDDNSPFVFPISIERGFEPSPLPPGDPGRTVEDDFYDLLDSIIINKDLLSDTFLMEVNIRTGVVLSIFYGDNHGRGRQAEFEYLDVADNLNINVTGGRGMGAGGYEFDYERAQGYYGVNWTGAPAPIDIPDIIDIYDGKNSGRPLEGRENVLYTEIFVPLGPNRDTDEFILDLVRSNNSDVSVITANEFSTPIAIDLSNIKSAGAGGIDSLDEVLRHPNFRGPGSDPMIYYPSIQLFDIDSFGINVGPLYEKFIWVLDCVYGDLFETLDNHGINRYIYRGITDPQLIRATVTRVGGYNDGMETISLTTDHSHYGGDLSGDKRYIIRSARHLSNIREFPDAYFRQTEDIDLDKIIMVEDTEFRAPVTNFKPIASFSGTFEAIGATGNENRPRILNLHIKDNSQNVGLFASTYDAVISGLSIYEAHVESISTTSTTRTYVGAIAGRMIGGTLRYSYSYANVIGGSAPDSRTGGLVGYLSIDGLIDQCFNAGFFNTNEIDPDTGLNWTSTFERINAVTGTGSVTGRGGDIGGLVGHNSGTIRSSFNNARVNIANVGVTNYLSHHTRQYPALSPTLLTAVELQELTQVL
jgi:hypothetical protein